MPQERKTRGGGGSENLPPLDDALSSEEGCGTYSYGYRSVDRDANNLPRMNRYNKRGQKTKFYDTLDYGDVATMEPPTTEGKYSSSKSGFDKYAEEKKSHSSSSHRHHDSGHHASSSSRHDDSSKHSSSKHSSSKHTSSKHHGSGSSCKDPKGKGKDKRDDDYDYDGGSSRAYGGTSSGSYYGGSGSGGYSSYYSTY
ncbi:hypothetical protein PG984_012963 [Apiospora sp. TS-2023a]